MLLPVLQLGSERRATFLLPMISASCAVARCESIVMYARRSRPLRIGCIMKRVCLLCSRTRKGPVHLPVSFRFLPVAE